MDKLIITTDKDYLMTSKLCQLCQLYNNIDSLIFKVSNNCLVRF